MPTSPKPLDGSLSAPSAGAQKVPVVPTDADAKVSHKVAEDRDPIAPEATVAPVEIGGRVGPEPTRFGDWEKNGRCIDF